MKSHFCFRIPYCLILLLAGGCAGISPFDGVRDDALAYNKQLEEFNNKVTLLNILRAYHRLPRHYTAISDLKGNYTYNTGGSLTGATPLGNGKSSTLGVGGVPVPSGTTVSRVADSLTTGISGSYQTSPNYTVAILESQEFYSGIMNPIPLDTIALFVQQGWESELLANLLLEDIVFKLPKQKRKKDAQISTATELTYIIENESREAGWTKLADTLEFQTKSFPAKITPLYATATLDPGDIAKLAEQNLSVTSCDSGGSTGLPAEAQKYCDAARRDTKAQKKQVTTHYLVFKPSPGSIGFSLRRNKPTPDPEIFEYMVGADDVRELRAQESNRNLLDKLDECNEKDCDSAIEPIKKHLIEQGLLKDDDQEDEELLAKLNDSGSFLKHQSTFEKWVRLRHYFENCSGGLFEFQSDTSSPRANPKPEEPYCNAASVNLSARSTEGVMYYVGEYARRIHDAAIVAYENGESEVPNESPTDCVDRIGNYDEQADAVDRSCSIWIGQGIDGKDTSPMFVLLPRQEGASGGPYSRTGDDGRHEHILKAFYGRVAGECGVRHGYIPGRTKNSSNYYLEETVNGQSHFVPTSPECGGRSLQVLTMLQHLLNLNKKADDLPKPQLIQIQ